MLSLLRFCCSPGNVVAGFIDGTEVKDWFTCGGNNGIVGTPKIKAQSLKNVSQIQLTKNEQTILKQCSVPFPPPWSGLHSVGLHVVWFLATPLCVRADPSTLPRALNRLVSRVWAEGGRLCKATQLRPLEESLYLT